MEVKGNINSSKNDVFISIVSLWEIAIKVSIGKLKLSLPFEEFLADIMKLYDFEILPIKDDYLNGLIDLPRIHKDPFDRMLISTAISDGLIIITRDEKIQMYDVAWAW